MPISEEKFDFGTTSSYQSWSSDGLPESEQFGYWAEKISEVYGPIRVSRAFEGAFRMNLVETKLGPLTMWSLEAQAHRAERDAEMAKKDQTGMVYVSVPTLGRLVGRQRQSILTLDQGWVGMIPSGQPASVSSDSNFGQLIIGLKAELVLDRLADVQNARMVQGEVPALLARRTAHLFARTSDFANYESSLLAAQLVDLVVASFGAKPNGNKFAPGLVRQLAMDEAMKRLGDADLNVEALAASVNVSRSTLEKLFAERGFTVHRWLVTRRLEAAKVDLENSDLTVEAIAYRWGFVDRTHFSRVFSKQFEISPAQYRKLKSRSRTA